MTKRVRTTIELDPTTNKKLKAIASINDATFKSIVEAALVASVINWEKLHGRITMTSEMIIINFKDGRSKKV